VERATGIEPV